MTRRGCGATHQSRPGSTRGHGRGRQARARAAGRRGEPTCPAARVFGARLAPHPPARVRARSPARGRPRPRRRGAAGRRCSCGRAAPFASIRIRMGPATKANRPAARIRGGPLRVRAAPPSPRSESGRTANLARSSPGDARWRRPARGGPRRRRPAPPTPVRRSSPACQDLLAGRATTSRSSGPRLQSTSATSTPVVPQPGQPVPSRPTPRPRHCPHSPRFSGRSSPTTAAR